MNKTNFYIFIISLLVFSCKSEKPEPLFSGGKPAPIKDYSITDLPGAVKITYTIPDKKTLSVKAVCEIKDGVAREARSSKYDNELILDGFPASKDYDVKLYAIGKGEDVSEPLVVSVHPLTPPYLKAMESLDLEPDYGGGRIQLINETKASLMVGVIALDSSGEWEEVHKEYTSSQEVNFSFRGYKPVERKFGVYVRDQWQNYSDTLLDTFAPFEEIKIPLAGSDYQPVTLPGDSPARNRTSEVYRLFDGSIGGSSTAYYSDNSLGTPQHITIYLQGKTYQLNRMKMWVNHSAYPKYAYTSSQPKRFRVWGSMDPNPNGELDSTWTVLGLFDDWKPSGLPDGELSDEDIEAGRDGNDFTFEKNVPVKYLRFETLTTWTPSTHVYIIELAFWGREEN